MSRNPRRQSHNRASVASSASAAFLAGLLVLGVSALLLGVLAAEGGTTPLSQTSIRSGNGTFTLAKPVSPYAPQDAVLEVSYAFPDAPGDAYLVDCRDYERILRGDAPQDPAVWRKGERQGAFERPMRNYLGFGTYTFYYPANDSENASTRDDARGGSGTWVNSETGQRYSQEHCFGAFVVFQWEADTSNGNRPAITAHVREVPLDSRFAGVLFALTAAAALVAVLGGLAWGRRRRARPPPPSDGGTSTAETLYRLAERSEAWLARTRRYVLISGPLGIFIWYPVLIPWAWRMGQEGSARAWMPWTLSAGVLLLLAGLTSLWAREFLRLDRELAAWRRQLRDLRRREEELMAELSG